MSDQIEDDAPKTIITGLPPDDLYSTLYDLPANADLPAVAVYLLEVVLTYTEACRRIATLESHGFELLTGVYNTSADTIRDIAVYLSRDVHAQDETSRPGSED